VFGNARRLLSSLRTLTRHAALSGCFAGLLLVPASRAVADTFTWNTNKNLVTADIKGGQLLKLLQQIARATGWQVFVEPETLHNVSTKFKDLPPGEALHLLLGDVNFMLLPETNRASRLFVFRTSRQNATQAVRPAKLESGKAIPNELIVRLKPGEKIDELAKQLGAKVIGRIDKLNAYRLQFDDEAAANSARGQLADNPAVASVESNYAIDPPPMPVGTSGAAPMPQLQMKAPPASGRVVVGLIDTAVQPLGGNLDQFLQKQLSVAGDSNLDPNTPAHGTSMADTILRSLQAITKGSTSVQILPVDVYGPNTSTTSFDVANGIVTAVNKGANVINLSLGSSADSPVLHDVINGATSQNILLIGAAGNEPVTTPFYPAAYSGVNAVTAIDQGQIASYANRGSFISLGAPGSNLIPFDNLAFGVQGTSVSSAYISGVAAGYMDSSHSTTAQAQSFLNSNFGVKITPSK
jgi:hypothetical protein